MRPGPRLAALLSLGLLLAVGASLLVPWGSAVFSLTIAATLLFLSRSISQALLPQEVEASLSGPTALTQATPARFELIVTAAARPLRLEIALDLPQGLSADPAHLLLSLPPGETRRVPIQITGLRRGHFDGGRLQLCVGEPVGLWERRLELPGPQEIRVYPRATAAGDVRARGLAPGPGAPRRRRGRGGEFDSLRPYAPGEDPRTIHWPTTARMGRPWRRVYAAEESPRILVLLDCSRRMAPLDQAPFTRLDRAVDAALRLSSEEERVGALTFDRRVLRERLPTRGARRALIELLYDARSSDFEPDYAELFRHLRDRLRRRTLLVLLTSPEGPSGLMEALPLVTDRHRVLVAAVGDRGLRRLAGLTPNAAPIQRTSELHARASALQLIEARRADLRRLRGAGVEVLDVDAGELEGALLERLRRVRAQGPV